VRLPYLVIAEKNLQNKVQELPVNPFQSNPDLEAANPLRKIPTLILNNGEALFDSPVICHYLDDLSDETPLIPQNNNNLKWSILRWEALADGIMDAAYNVVMERLRPNEEQSASWIARWSEEIQLSLQHIENSIHELGKEPTLAHLALGAAIGYVDFRLSGLLYESEYPQVAIAPNTLTWYEAFRTRPSMLDTQPFDKK
jgi:glutathione S-transferase